MTNIPWSEAGQLLVGVAAILGTLVPAREQALEWDANPEPDVAAYEVTATCLQMRPFVEAKTTTNTLSP